MRHEDFKPEHLLAFADPFATLAYGHELLKRGPAYTVRAEQILLCGGIAADDAGCGWLWSFVAPAASAHFLRLHGYVKRFLEVNAQPLSATAAQTGPGCRWLEALGFARVQPMAGFFPGCPDQFVYRRG
jgi:hypothetical protein